MELANTYIAHIVLLHRGMLRTGVGELRKSGEERFDTRSWYADELP